MPKPTTALVLAALLGLSAAGCGTSRPSEADLAEALTQPNAVVPVPKGSAKCAAKVLEDSKLSNKILDAIAENDGKRRVPAKDEKILEKLFEKMADCIPN